MKWKTQILLDVMAVHIFLVYLYYKILTLWVPQADIIGSQNNFVGKGLSIPFIHLGLQNKYLQNFLSQYN